MECSGVLNLLNDINNGNSTNVLKSSFDLKSLQVRKYFIRILIVTLANVEFTLYISFDLLLVCVGTNVIWVKLCHCHTKETLTYMLFDLLEMPIYVYIQKPNILMVINKIY